VRALVRSRAKAAEALPRDEGLHLVQAEALTSSAAGELVRGASACINAIGILRETTGQTFRKAHVETPHLLTQACREARAGRFVQVSALGVSGEGRTGYQQSKFEGERIVQRSGLAWTILRPSLIHGARGEFIRMARGWATGKQAPWFFLPYFTRGEPAYDAPLPPMRRTAASVAPVAVEDVAWAAAESLERDEAIGEIFNLSGPETLCWPDLLRAIRDAVPGTEEYIEPLGIPSEIAAVKARVARKLGLGGLLPFDEGMAAMGAADSIAEREKVRQMLSFEPRPFVRTLRGYAARIA
jgi:NADH dehydrogenase